MVYGFICIIHCGYSKVKISIVAMAISFERLAFVLNNN